MRAICRKSRCLKQSPPSITLHGQILPRAAAIVHQGGAGTTGQALRAGVLTLAVPFNHDQPDNASRIARLGVGRRITRAKYTADNAARELDELLTDKDYAERAAEVGRTVEGENGACRAAGALETFIEKGFAGRMSEVNSSESFPGSLVDAG
jgi:UDP:flavonoid glycosyltransferase YjiC (YdhE family)